MYWHWAYDNPSSFTILLAFVSILLYHTRHSVLVYGTTFRKSSSIPLLIHIGAGSFEIVRYRWSATPEGLRSDYVDLIACFLQSYTNLALVKTLVRGTESTRPAYQVAALARPVIGCVAFFSGDPDMHRASVKLVNAFIYTRMIIFVAGVFKWDRFRSWSEVYAAAVFFSAVMAFHESGLPAAVPVYVGMVALLTELNRYTSRAALKSPKDIYPGERLLIRCLVGLGLAQLPTIKSSTEHLGLMASVDDVYTEEE